MLFLLKGYFLKKNLMKNLNILIILYFFTTGCGNLSEAGKVLKMKRQKLPTNF